MTLSRFARLGLFATSIVVVLAACTAASSDDPPTPVVIQPGAPGEPNRTLSAEEIASLPTPTYGEADVEFMQNMIPHHVQALEMGELIADRSERDDLPLFAERMTLSQEDEIALITRWLEERGEDVPQVDAETVHDGHLMPGMLTREEFEELQAASGEEFDQLFLQSMIRHHQGALQMVEELLATEGAAAEPEIFQFARHVDSDQRIELDRMESMLAELQAAGD